MKFSSLSLLWLLAMAAPAPAAERVDVSARARPFASTTLLLSGNFGLVTVLSQTNVAVKLVPAQAQNLNIARQLDFICLLPPNYGIRSVGAWVDSPYHSVPLTVLEYKDFNPSYIKVEIDTIFLRNRINDVDLANHKIRIDFYADPRTDSAPALQFPFIEPPFGLPF